MLHFSLDVTNLPIRGVNTLINVFETKDPKIIQNSIDNFNKEIKWDGMFDLEEANRRFLNNSIMFVAEHDKSIYGHCWLNEISELKYKIYNVYSQNSKTPKNYGATDMLFYVIKNYTKGVVVADVDEWNEKSINMFKKLGFEEI
jgi:hypothetical protein